MTWGIVAGLLAGALWGLVFVAPRLTPGLSSLDLAAGRFIAYGAMSAVASIAEISLRAAWAIPASTVAGAVGRRGGQRRPQPLAKEHPIA